MFQCKFLISLLQKLTSYSSLKVKPSAHCSLASPASLSSSSGWLDSADSSSEITPSSGPGLDALCCSCRSTITITITFTLIFGLTFCQQIQIHVMVMVAVIYTSTVLSFTKSLSCSHIIRAVVGIVVTSIIET